MTIANIQLKPMDPAIAAITSMISGGQKTEKIGDGMFICGHWNFDDHLDKRWEPYWHDRELQVPSFGVCDSPVQFLEKCGDSLRNDAANEYVISFVLIKQEDQPPDGGWRWHKWGEYIGDKSPQFEYLFDEPDINEVYTFHVYRKSLDQ